MVRVIGVRFRTAGKIYFFDPLNFEIRKGQHVIVETARGIEFGLVVAGVMEVAEDKVVQPLKPVIRIANQRDIEQEAANRDREKEAFRICQEKIREHGLEMKLIDAEYTFDNNKVLFYFTADGRIDFRELVKDLASVFKTRIELRQIGVRDETKIMGGIGICGRALCCHSYLADFVPVSIKMAKEQNLSLNPAKISGVCGRLMCCLKNEEETYEELNRRLPGIGDPVATQDGFRGEVHSVNVLRQLVKVVVDVGDEKDIREYPVEQLTFRRRHGKKEKVNLSKEELQELERLEVQDQPESSAQTSESSAGGAKPEGERRQGKNRQESRNRQGGSSKRESSQRENSQRENSRRGNSQRGNSQTENSQKENPQRESNQRGAQNSGRESGQQSGDANRHSAQRSGGRYRQSGGGGQRQPADERQSGGEHRQSVDERQPQAGQHLGENQTSDQHQGGKNRQENKNRREKHRKNNKRQENSDNQGEKNRYDNKSRQDTKENLS